MDREVQSGGADLGATVPRRVIVIARFNEDVSWIKGLPDGWIPRVVQKGVDMPNEGREPGSFHWAIVEHYDEIHPEDTWAFVQGNPFDHCRELFTRLQSPIGAYTALGDAWHVTNGDGCPAHCGLPVEQKHREWIGGPFPVNVSFVAGGQFMVRGEVILRRPKDYYRNLMQDIAVDQNAWVAERLWGELFAPVKE